MSVLSNIPPGVTDYDIERQAGAFDEPLNLYHIQWNRDFELNAVVAAHDEHEALNLMEFDDNEYTPTVELIGTAIEGTEVGVIAQEQT